VALERRRDVEGGLGLLEQMRHFFDPINDSLDRIRAIQESQADRALKKKQIDAEIDRAHQEAKDRASQLDINRTAEGRQWIEMGTKALLDFKREAREGKLSEATIAQAKAATTAEEERAKLTTEQAAGAKQAREQAAAEEPTRMAGLRAETAGREAETAKAQHDLDYAIKQGDQQKTDEAKARLEELQASTGAEKARTAAEELRSKQLQRQLDDEDVKFVGGEMHDRFTTRLGIMKFAHDQAASDYQYFQGTPEEKAARVDARAKEIADPLLQETDANTTSQIRSRFRNKPDVADEVLRMHRLESQPRGAGSASRSPEGRTTALTSRPQPGQTPMLSQAPEGPRAPAGTPLERTDLPPYVPRQSRGLGEQFAGVGRQISQTFGLDKLNRVLMGPEEPSDPATRMRNLLATGRVDAGQPPAAPTPPLAPGPMGPPSRLYGPQQPSPQDQLEQLFRVIGVY
jgi:hypothetical protein